MSKPWLHTSQRPTSEDRTSYYAKVNADGKSTGTKDGLALFAAANRAAALLVDAKKQPGKKVSIGGVGETRVEVRTYQVSTGNKLNPISK